MKQFNKIARVCMAAALFVIMAVPSGAAGPSFSEGGKNVGRGFKEVFIATGRACKDSGKAVGRGFKKAGIETGRAFRQMGRDIGHAFSSKR